MELNEAGKGEVMVHTVLLGALIPIHLPSEPGSTVSVANTNRNVRWDTKPIWSSRGGIRWGG